MPPQDDDLATFLRERNSALEQLDVYCVCKQCAHAKEVIKAQHDETGRIWSGPRWKLPRRYEEVHIPYPLQLLPDWTPKI